MNALEQFKNDPFNDQISEDRSSALQSIKIPIVPDVEFIEKLSNENQDKSLKVLKKKTTHIRQNTQTTLINSNENKTNTLAGNAK